MIALEKLKKYTDKNRIFDFHRKMQRNGKWLLVLKSKTQYVEDVRSM